MQARFRTVQSYHPLLARLAVPLQVGGDPTLTINFENYITLRAQEAFSQTDDQSWLYL